jgi:hypothetical protein
MDERFARRRVKGNDMMNETRYSDHGMNLGSLLVGLAAGVAGTILYATYREREFNKIVGKTRKLSDRSSEYLGHVGDTVKSKAVAMVDSAQNAVDGLADKARNKMSNDRLTADSTVL